MSVIIFSLMLSCLSGLCQQTVLSVPGLAKYKYLTVSWGEYSINTII